MDPDALLAGLRNRKLKSVAPPPEKPLIVEETISKPKVEVETDKVISKDGENDVDSKQSRISEVVDCVPASVILPTSDEATMVPKQVKEEPLPFIPVVDSLPVVPSTALLTSSNVPSTPLSAPLLPSPIPLSAGFSITIPDTSPTNSKRLLRSSLLNQLNTTNCRPSMSTAKALSPSEQLIADHIQKFREQQNLSEREIVTQRIFSLSDLRIAGYSVNFLCQCTHLTAAQLRKEGGFAAEELLESGRFSLPELKRAGYSTAELRRAGLSVALLLQMGYTVAALLAEGAASVKELREAGVPAHQLRGEGVTLDQLVDGGFDAIALRAAGYGAGDIAPSLFPDPSEALVAARSLRRAGYSAQQLKQAGFHVGELASCQISYEEMRDIGFSLLDLWEGGYAVEVERQVLTNLYESTNGMEWKVRRNWLNPKLSVGQWFGVTVEPFTQLVIHLQLADNNLCGSLPSELTVMRRLRVLDLHNNALCGSLPSGLLQMPQLHYVNSLGNMDVAIDHQLEVGELSDTTPLCGRVVPKDMMPSPIPALKSPLWTPSTPRSTSTLVRTKPTTAQGMVAHEYWELQRIALVSLFYSANGHGWKNKTNWCSQTLPLNKWHGIKTTPHTVLDHTTGLSETVQVVTTISLACNNLKGTVPTDLFLHLHGLKAFDVRSNQLSGQIPRSIETVAKTLTHLHLNCNRFSGDGLSLWLPMMHSLIQCDVSSNQLTGPYPDPCLLHENLSDIRQLNLSSNLLTIPEEWVAACSLLPAQRNQPVVRKISGVAEVPNAQAMKRKKLVQLYKEKLPWAYHIIL